MVACIACAHALLSHRVAIVGLLSVTARTDVRVSACSVCFACMDAYMNTYTHIWCVLSVHMPPCSLTCPSLLPSRISLRACRVSRAVNPPELQILFAAKMHKELDADRLACPHLVHVRLRERYAPSNAIVAEKLDSPAVLEIWGQLIKRHERVQEASPDTAQHEPRLHSEGLERRGLFCELRGQPVVAQSLVRTESCRNSAVHRRG